jgi:hypothetical protein
MRALDGKRFPRWAVWRYDMNGFRAELLTNARAGHNGLPPGAPLRAERRRGAHVSALDRPLQCVSSGYLSDGCSCSSRVPAAVVTAAWRNELECGRLCEGFFHFAWRGGVWLAYGQPDGRVRGVYCPAHRSEREERLGYDPELALASTESSR